MFFWIRVVGTVIAAVTFCFNVTYLTNVNFASSLIYRLYWVFIILRPILHSGFTVYHLVERTADLVKKERAANEEEEIQMEDSEAEGGLSST